MSKVEWKVGDDKLQTTPYQSIPYWKKQSVTIYPHMILNNYLNYEAIVNLATQVKTKMKDKGYECELYDKNTYTRELNGSWNVVIGIKHTREEDSTKKVYQAMYLFRHDSNYNETYGCPFYNSEYVYDLHHYSVHNNKSLFNTLETSIKEIKPEFKPTTYFRTD